jgi:hypothetical protein
MVYLAPITRRDPLCGPESVVKYVEINTSAQDYANSLSRGRNLKWRLNRD